MWTALPVSRRGYPPAVAEGSLTDCGSHGVVSFGGNTGKSTVSAAVHVLNPTNGTWLKMTAGGVRVKPYPYKYRPLHSPASLVASLGFTRWLESPF